MSKIGKEEIPPRPLCGCGEPGVYQVTLSVRRLELDRSGGSGLCWIGSYRSTHTNIESIVCETCLRGQIKVNVSVDASMTGATPKL